ncbi:MAG: hypothetical protein ABI967_14130 [bacterium]
MFTRYGYRSFYGVLGLQEERRRQVAAAERAHNLLSKESMDFKAPLPPHEHLARSILTHCLILT